MVNGLPTAPRGPAPTGRSSVRVRPPGSWNIHRHLIGSVHERDSSPDSDPDTGVPWGTLVPGQHVTIREAGRQTGHGVIDAVTPDTSIVWVRVDGQAPRRMFLAGDPVEIIPGRP